MKMNWLILIVSALALACGNDEEPLTIPTPGSEGSSVRLDDSRKKVDHAKANKSGDDFELVSAVILQEYLEVEVRYAGGCKKHQFDFVWAEPEDSLTVEVAIIHDSNGDGCEALLTEKIAVKYEDMPPSTQLIRTHKSIRIINASNQQSVVIYEGLPSFRESEECILTVSTDDVICGDGLFENRWLRYASTDDGQPVYLQPTDLAALIQLSGKIEPGDYRVGVKLSGPFESGSATCLAYPGPSIPVSIWCLEKDN